MWESRESKSVTYDVEGRIEAARARLDAQFAAAAAARADADAGLEELRALSVTVRSAGGECAITSSAEGKITDVTVAHGLRTDARLSAVLVETIARAQAAARGEAADRAATLFGEASPLVAQLRSSTGDRGVN